MKCEMCGQDAKLKKVKVEGAVLKLCKNCQDTGEVISAPRKVKNRFKKKKKRRKPRSQRKHLVKDFDKKVKAKRESEEMSIEDLSEQMKVKESVVHRIESGKLKPDEKLAKKIKKVLGIQLYQQESQLDYETRKKENKHSKATIGDIAKVKKKK